MKKIITLFIAVSIMLINANFVYADSILGGGDGTENNPYLISTETDLLCVADIPNSHWKLVRDILLTNNTILCLNKEFSGFFDGNNHTITSKITSSDNQYIGLFEKNNGTIRNLNLDIDIQISSSSAMLEKYVGGLVGYNSGTINNCNICGTVLVNGQIFKITTGGVAAYNTGNIIDTESSVEVTATSKGAFATAPTANAGGIVGYNTGNIYRCTSLDSITSYAKDIEYNTVSSVARSGGIIAQSDTGSVSECYSKSSLYSTAKNIYIGGLIAENSYASIENCYAIFNMSANLISGGQFVYTGGLIGSGYSNITNSYSVSNLAALVGYKGNGKITNSYYNQTTSGCSDTDKGTPMATLSMKIKSSYSGWDFSNTWGVSSEYNDGYPYLKWQIVSVNDILLNKNDVLLKLNESVSIMARVLPDNATNKTLVWTSADDSIATVDNGIITGVSEGTTNITVSDINSNVSKTILVTVSSNVQKYSISNLSILDINGNPVKNVSANDKSFYVEADVTKNDSDISKDMLILALYSKDNILISMTYMKATLTKGQSVTFGGMLTNTTGNAIGSIRGYVWKNINEMIPLSCVAEYDFDRQNPILIDTVLESNHPYSNSIDETQIYEYEGDCRLIDITFSNETSLDDGYDFIYIYDKDNKEVGVYTGTELAGKTITVSGNTVKIRLKSDNRETDYGYKTTSIIVYR